MLAESGARAGGLVARPALGNRQTRHDKAEPPTLPGTIVGRSWLDIPTTYGGSHV